MAAQKKKGTGAGGTGKRGSTARGARKGTSRTRPASGRADKSVEAFRDALDRNLTLSRERLQDVFDDAVRRGRMTRGDAEELISSIVSQGRQYTDDLVANLERLIEQARREADTRTAPARRAAAQAAGRVARGARDVADEPLARADQLRRRAGGPGFPISAYDQLTAAQVKTRLGDLSAAELRKVRTREKNGKGRKGILSEIERRLK